MDVILNQRLTLDIFGFCLLLFHRARPYALVLRPFRATFKMLLFQSIGLRPMLCCFALSGLNMEL
jgi:hypothetical protein